MSADLCGEAVLQMRLMCPADTSVTTATDSRTAALQAAPNGQRRIPSPANLTDNGHH